MPDTLLLVGLVAVVGGIGYYFYAKNQAAAATTAGLTPGQIAANAASVQESQLLAQQNNRGV
jgi:hypothetical protein